jgi:hypothetical protein
VLIAKLFVPVLFQGEAQLIHPYWGRCRIDASFTCRSSSTMSVLQPGVVSRLFRHFLRSARVTSDAHVCEGPGKPIFGDLAVQVAILHIKSDTLIIVGPVKDSSVRVVSHYLITYGIICNS